MLATCLQPWLDGQQARLLQVRLSPDMPQLRLTAFPPALRSAADLMSHLPPASCAQLGQASDRRSQHRSLPVALSLQLSPCPACCRVCLSGRCVCACSRQVDVGYWEIESRLVLGSRQSN